MDSNGHGVAAVQLTITIDPTTGAVNVNGPIGNKMFCYGLLEMAREAIADHNKQPASSITLLPPGSRIA